MENTIQSDLIRGHINTIILKALFDGDRYGYDIVREIEQKSSGQYKLKQPTLYSCLKRLEIQGFIRSYWGAKSNGGRRKYFTLTDMGRELFIKNQSEWEYSRTVIDKLISDKEVDLSEMSPIKDETEEPEDYLDEISVSNDMANTDNDIVNADSVTESSYTDNSESETEIKTTESFNNETVATSNNDESDKQIVFSDTTEIMNELFRRQTNLQNDSSYTEKLLSEKYVSDRTDNTISSDTYFKDFLDDTPSDSDIITQDYESTLTEKEPLLQQEENQEEPTVQKPSDMFLDYHTSTVIPNSNNSVIEREYRNILGDFLNPSFIERPHQVESAPQYENYEEPKNEEQYKEESNEDSAPNTESYNYSDDNYTDQIDNEKDLELYTNDADVNRKLNKLTGEVREMGDNVIIRTHNNESSKEYSNTYYYYSNKLMIVHYGILFAIMMLEILFTAVFVNLILNKGQPSDKWFYILAAVVAIVFPIVAFIKNFTMPNKRKRINFSLKNSLIYRFIIMAQCFLIIYCVNIIGGMQLSFDYEHITTVLLPALLCTGFPVSALIFNALFKTKKFSVEQ